MNSNISCESAKGKSNIFSLLEKSNKDYLIVADGAAFGSEIDRITKIIKNKNINLFLPESFEWLILISKIINDNKLNNILSNTSDYIESNEFFSWERFFNDYLVKITANTKYSYSK